MKHLLITLAILFIAASLPAPIVERGGTPSGAADPTEAQLLEQTSGAQPMSEVGEVPVDTSPHFEGVSHEEAGSGAISAASKKLRSEVDGKQALATAEARLQEKLSHRWWKLPLYGAIISIVAFGATMVLRSWIDRKVPAPGPKRTAGPRK